MATGELHPVAPALAGTRFADVRWVRETTSTNADLLAAAAAGAPEGLVLVADHQTAGRGRLGRRWESAPAAGLLLSVLLRPSLPPARLHLCTLAVGVAAVEACDAVAGVRPGLKWPNDLVAGDGKLGGVLAETTVAGGTVDAVVVGLGINLRAEDLPAGAVALEELASRPFEGGVLLVTLLRGLDRWWGEVAGGTGIAGLVAAAREASATLGRTVRVEQAGGVVEGRAEELDDDGHLVVVDAAGRRHVVAAGDVTHVRAFPPA